MQTRSPLFAYGRAPGMVAWAFHRISGIGVWAFIILHIFDIWLIAGRMAMSCSICCSCCTLAGSMLCRSADDGQATSSRSTSVAPKPPRSIASATITRNVVPQRACAVVLVRALA